MSPSTTAAAVRPSKVADARPAAFVAVSSASSAVSPAAGPPVRVARPRPAAIAPGPNGEGRYPRPHARSGTSTPRAPPAGARSAPPPSPARAPPPAACHAQTCQPMFVAEQRSKIKNSNLQQPHRAARAGHRDRELRSRVPKFEPYFARKLSRAESQQRLFHHHDGAVPNQNTLNMDWVSRATWGSRARTRRRAFSGRMVGHVRRPVATRGSRVRNAMRSVECSPFPESAASGYARARARASERTGR